MPQKNRIAVYGHRGWASSVIVQALADSGTPLKVLYRPGSDVTALPPGAIAVEVDIADKPALINTLEDVDILISLVGHEGVTRQHRFVEALPSTAVKLFVPSDLGFRCDGRGLQLPINRAKRDVEESAKAAGVPTTVVMPGCLVESSFCTTMLGVDVSKNSITYMGNSEHEKISTSSIAYTAAAYVALFANTPIVELQGRVIGLAELHISGSEIAAALQKRHKEPPQVLHQSIDVIDREIDSCLADGKSLALAWYCRRVWAAGASVQSIGEDIFDVPGYPKATADSLFAQGQMGTYRNLPPQVAAMFDAMQDKATV